MDTRDTSTIGPVKGETMTAATITRDLRKKFAAILSDHGISELRGDLIDDLVSCATDTIRRKPKTQKGIEHELFMSVIAGVTRADPDAMRGQLARASKTLRESGEGYTTDDIVAGFGDGGWWYREDWRGKRGEIPTIANVVALLKQARDALRKWTGSGSDCICSWDLGDNGQSHFWTDHDPDCPVYRRGSVRHENETRRYTTSAKYGDVVQH